MTAPMESDREHMSRRLRLFSMAEALTNTELRDAIYAEAEDADRLHRQLVAARAEAEGLAESLANSERLYTQHLNELRARTAAVADLHHPITLMGQVWCDACSVQRQTGPRTTERIAYIPHPCPTIQALDTAPTP